MSFYGAKVKEDEGDDNYKICSLANESGTGEFAIYKVLPGIRVVYNDINMLIGWYLYRCRRPLSPATPYK